MRNFGGALGLRGTSVGGVTVYPVAPWLASQAHVQTITNFYYRNH